MVTRVGVLLLLLGLSLSGLAATKVRGAAYELDRDTLALGEPLQLRITRAVGARGASLETLDLSVLQRDFEIQERTLGRDSLQETLTLTLYARRSGRYTLPTLGLSGRAPRLSVTEGSDRVPRVQWKLSLDPPEPLLRQPVTFTLEACDDGSLLWKRPSLPLGEGRLLRPLNETEVITTRDGQRCTAHRWHWALLPTAAGPQQLALPVLEAHKFGRRLRFTAPALAYTSQPLPGWVPAQAAVGQPRFEAEPLPAQAVLDQPLAWRMNVSGAWSAQALQDLLALQLRQADARLGLDRYALQVEPQATLAPVPLHRVTLYLLPRERGTFDLPALQLPWYDPASGQLMHARLSAMRIDVVDPWRARWRIAAAVLATSIPVVLLLVALGSSLRWRWRRRELQRRLHRARTPDALRRQLLAFDGPTQAQARVAATLGEWQQLLQQRWVASDTEGLVAALDAACFSAASTATAMPALQRLAAQWAASLRPRHSGWRRR